MEKEQQVLTEMIGEGGAVECTIGDLLEELRHNTIHMHMREPLQTRFETGVHEMCSLWRNSDGLAPFGPLAYALTKVLKEAFWKKEEEFDYLWEALEDLNMIVILASLDSYKQLLHSGL